MAVAENDADLLLMDIHIRGEYDGIELAQMIRVDHTTPIIFITSLKDDMTFRRASRVGATNFIIKPFDQLQLQRAIELVVSQVEKTDDATPINDGNEPDHFFAKKNDQFEKINFEDINYVETEGQYCFVYANEKKYVLTISLNQFALRLPKGLFLQTHRSFIINKSKIKSVNPKENTILIENEVIPISRRNKKAVFDALGWILE